MISMGLDILVAVLLVVTIGYAVVLNRRLSALRKDNGELERMAQVFTEATSRAEDGIARLKQTSDDLQDRMAAAQALADDLRFLIERGGNTADRLEHRVRQARDGSGAGAEDKRTVGVETRQDAGEEPAPAPADGPDAGRSDAERDLLRALRAVR